MASGTRATVALTRAGVAFTLHPYRHRASAETHGGFGDEAARALGVDPARIFKTLIASVDAAPVCAVVPVASRLDTKALASAAGGKRAELADPRVCARVSGYVLGGVCPIGLRTAMPVFIDASAQSFATIYLSAGKRGLQLELTPADLLSASGGRLAQIAAQR